MADYAIGPVPTPNPPAGVSYTPQLAGGQIYNQGGTGNADTVWNQGWNEGFNNPYKSVSSYMGASDQNWNAGYLAGQQEYFNRNKTTTTPTPTNTKSPTNTNTNQGTSFDSIYASMYPGWDRNAAEQDWIAKGRPMPGGGGGGGIDLNAQLRNEIESGYNDYISNLESMYGGLDSQAQAQRDIAQRSYDQSIKDLGLNKESSLQDLGVSQGKVEANQVKNLRDIADNIRNQYMAGNVMLGARGAGDSSAANQYSYALNRVGSRERGNVMNQTASLLADLDLQRAKLNNIVTQETSRLDTELGNSLSQITSWLAEQQNSIKNMIAQGKLNKSQDIASLTRDRLNQAVAAYQEKQRDIASKKAALESWAMTNADNISKLATNMKSIGQFVPNMPYANPLNGSVSVDSQGNIRGMYGYGANKDEEHPYFRY